MRGAGPVPAPVLVVAAIVSVQFGGALAATLLPLVGVAGSVTLRLVIAVAILLLLARPRLRGYRAADWATVVAFGVALAGMNLAFYASLSRLPLGVAVTIEFVGPLALAAVLSRRRRDAAAVATAALGVVLISRVIEVRWADLDHVGIGFALLAGAAWAAYIVLSGRTGQRFPQLDGLTLAMVVAAILVAPAGVGTAGAGLLAPDVLLRGAGIALLSSVLPYSLELFALRRMRAHVFGVLLSLEPALAALAGYVVLRQVLTPVQLVGMALVVAASIAVARPSPPGGAAEGGSAGAAGPG